jgi:hypothetical protein
VDAFAYLKIIATGLFDKPAVHYVIHQQPFFYGIVLMFIMEWIHRVRQHGLQIERWPLVVRWFMYIGISVFIFMFGNFNQTEFIYFAF